MEIITSRSNPLCTHLRKLASDRAYRRKSGEFLCDSPKLLEEALLHGGDLRAVVATEDAALPPIPQSARPPARKPARMRQPWATQAIPPRCPEETWGSWWRRPLLPAGRHGHPPGDACPAAAPPQASLRTSPAPPQARVAYGPACG